jgi:hypothetical protein
MIEGLKVEEGDEVLDIGSGCGVTSALIAYLVCPSATFNLVYARHTLLPRPRVASMLAHLLAQFFLASWPICMIVGYGYADMYPTKRTRCGTIA